MGDSGDTPLTVRVVRSIADARGAEPDELPFRLGDTIDTDALDALAAHDGTDWELTFEIEDHTVRIAPDQPVMVDGTEYR